MRKLQLRKETLATLTEDQAAEAMGGRFTDRCPFSFNGCQFSDLCPTSFRPSRCTTAACD